MSEAWHIRGGRLVDPATGRDEVADLYVERGAIVAALSREAGPVRVFDAAGRVVVPGLMDLHVHLREPGNEEAETVESGCRAAARGGFTLIVAMPNTVPPLDTPSRVAEIPRRADAAGLCRVRVAACITQGREGKTLTDMPALVKAGAAAFTDDGSTVSDRNLMREAMRTAATLGVPVMDHALDPGLASGGVMHGGAVARRLALPGIPSEAEAHIVRRDIELAEETGGALHVQHLSTAGSAELIRGARARGLKVTAEVTPHHLALTHRRVRPDDADFKMSPPLCTEADRQALLAAAADGTIQAFATDHAPHRAADKARGFLAAPFGVVGLETAVGVTWSLLGKTGRLSLLEWVRRWTTGPAAVLGLPPPSLAIGRAADLAVLDLTSPWVVEPARFLSRSRNSPFKGATLQGRSELTLLAGAAVWDSRC